MPTSELSYTASNTDIQAIDTFDLPTVLSATYTIHAFGKTDKSITSINVIHDGSNTAFSQHGTSLSGNNPIAISASIVDYEGKILVQPSEVPMTFKIFKNELNCNLYSESTISGSLIKTEEGFSLDRTGTIDSITIRQSNNNFYGDPATYINGTTLGPVSTLDELITSSWRSNNGSEFSSNNSHIVASSSGQANNCLFQELSVEPGKLYRISGAVSYELSDTPLAKQVTYGSTGVPFIRIGNTLGSNEYLNIQSTDTETEFSLTFIPTGSSIFVSFGYGEILSKCVMKDFSLKSSQPFHSYKESDWTMYLSWNAVATTTELLTMTAYDSSTYTVMIDSSNSIIITSSTANVNCGSQSVVNKLAFNYSNGTIISSHNGSIQSDSAILVENIDHSEVNASVLQLAFMSSVISNTELTELTNV